MRDDLLVATLVTGARAGDRQAWEELVERYAPLVWAICRRMGLARPDVEDVGQQVWLRMIEHLGDLREPAALSGWLVTTTRRECLRVLAQRRAELARAAAGVQAAPARLPAAAGTADPRPSCTVPRDQCEAGHRRRQHRADQGEMPGGPAPLPRARCADQGGDRPRRGR